MLYNLNIQFQKYLEFNIEIDVVFTIKDLNYAIINIFKRKKTHLFSIEYTTSRVWQFLSAFMQHTCCVLIKCTVKIKDENILNLCL